MYFTKDGCTTVPILSHMLLLQCDWYSPPCEAGPVFLPLNLGELKAAPTTEYGRSDAVWLLRLSQTKEIVSTCFSLSGHSPWETSLYAANKSKLAHAEGPHEEAQVERNCGPKWHLVATASWVHEPSDNSCSQPHISYLMSQISWSRIGNPCPKALPREFGSIINVCFILLSFRVICHAVIVTGTKSFQVFLLSFHLILLSQWLSQTT